MIMPVKKSSGNTVVWENNLYEISLNSPSILKLFPTDLRPFSVHDSVRWLLQYPFGYSVYTMRIKNTHETIGYCVISYPGNFRYPFLGDKDILVGPYYIADQHRGNKYSVILISILMDLLDYENAWDFIDPNNLASIKVSKLVGFNQMCYANYSSILRILKPNDTVGDGSVILFSMKKEREII